MSVKRTRLTAVYLTALERDLVAQCLFAVRSDIELIRHHAGSDASVAFAKSACIKRLDQTRTLFLDKAPDAQTVDKIVQTKTPVGATP